MSKSSDSQAIETLAVIGALALLWIIFGTDAGEQIAKLVGFDR